MDIHVCKQCGSHFVYCRACVFKPIRYKDQGFCSKECYEASKNVVEPIKEEITIIEVEDTIQSSTEDILPVEEEISVEILADAEVFMETTEVAEPIIKKETNTYKKKKNKYRVHE